MHLKGADASLIDWIAPFENELLHVACGRRGGRRIISWRDHPEQRSWRCWRAPLTVTITLPVLTLVGAGTTIEVALQLLGVAVTPLKVTVLLP